MLTKEQVLEIRILKRAGLTNQRRRYSFIVDESF
jgi:hypothetical protein